MIKNKVKKVAILYSGGIGMYGIEKYLLDLFKFNNSDKVQLTLISMGNWSLTKAMRQAGYNVEIFDSKRISLNNLKNISKYLINGDFSLLASQGVVANAYARIISISSKVPNLVTVHSELRAEYNNPILRLIYKFSDRILRFKTCSYITVSNYLKNSLIQSGVYSSKVNLIYNGIDFKPAARRQRRRLVIGSLGRLNHVKNYDILIKAFALLDNKRIRLKIAGEGEELSNLKQLARELGVANRVEFVGFIDDINSFLDSIDVYAQTSKSEGFGISVVYAMSRELPVVVTPVGSLLEIVQDKVTGLVAESSQPESIAKSIDYLIKNYDESKQLGIRARQSALEKYNISKWADKTIRTYLKACNTK